MNFLSRIQSIALSPGFRRAELCMLFVLLALLFARRINYVQFFGDESYWISDSRYFDVLLSGDFSAEAWANVKILSDQPPLPRYLIGLSRRLAGYYVQDLNEHWRFSQDYQTNEAQGRLPSAGLLWWSRFPMALLAAASGVILFWLVNQAFSRLAGYLWLFQYVASYYITATLCKAMAESPLLVTVALAGVCGVLALREFRKAASTQPVTMGTFRYSLLWFLLLGVCSGLAASSKLNGAITAGAGPLLIAWVVLKYGDKLSRLQHGLFALIAGSAVILAAIATFLVLNPFLYHDPLNRALLFYTRPAHILAVQQERFVGDSIDGISERLQVVPIMIWQELAAARFPGVLWLNLALVVLGLIVILWQLRHWQRNDSRAIAGLTILSLVVTVCIPPLFTPLNWPRYYILPVVFSMILASLGLAQLISSAYSYARRQFAARPLPRPASPGGDFERGL